MKRNLLFVMVLATIVLLSTGVFAGWFGITGNAIDGYEETDWLRPVSEIGESDERTYRIQTINSQRYLILLEYADRSTATVTIKNLDDVDIDNEETFDKLERGGEFDFDGITFKLAGLSWWVKRAKVGYSVAEGVDAEVLSCTKVDGKIVATDASGDQVMATIRGNEDKCGINAVIELSCNPDGEPNTEWDKNEDEIVNDDDLTLALEDDSRTDEQWMQIYNEWITQNPKDGKQVVSKIIPCQASCDESGLGAKCVGYSCTDSDDPDDDSGMGELDADLLSQLTTVGVTRYGMAYVGRDKCLGDNVVQEYYCYSGAEETTFITAKGYYCPTATPVCSFGKCVAS